MKTDKIQKNIIKYFQENLGKNLVSIYAIGSFLTEDFIDGYSDIDLIIFVKKIGGLPHSERINELSDKNKIETGVSYVAFDDFLNRIEDNDKATRFFSNISALKMNAGQSFLLYGKNLVEMLPATKILLARDLVSELKECYFHVKSTDPGKNIFLRGPRKMLNYIINMSNDLLVSRGIFSKKNELAENMKILYPNFGSTAAIEKALKFRSEKKTDFNKVETNEVHRMLSIFLEDYLSAIKNDN